MVVYLNHRAMPVPVASIVSRKGEGDEEKEEMRKGRKGVRI